RDDDQLDRVRHPGESLDRVGEQPDVAGADALHRHRARDAEGQSVVAQVFGVDAAEPGVPGRLRQLGSYRRRDFGPQVIGGWGAHGTGHDWAGALLSTGPSTWVEKPGRLGPALLGPGGEVARRRGRPAARGGAP